VTLIPHHVLDAEVTVIRDPRATIEAPLGSGRSCHYEAGIARLKVGGVGTFEVNSDGSLVTAVVSPKADVETIVGWLYGSVLALTTVHQGRFALHASLVSLSGTGIAVAGRSGAGKSTLTLRLVQRGARLVTDDVSPVSLSGAGNPLVTTTGRPIHVWPSTVTLIGLDASRAHLCWPGTDKLALELPAAGRHPLDAVVVIRCEGTGSPSLERLSGADTVATLLQQTYRRGLLDSRWLAAHLAWTQAVSSRIPVFALTRPLAGNSVDRLAEHVEALAEALPQGPSSSCQDLVDLASNVEPPLR